MANNTDQKEESCIFRPLCNRIINVIIIVAVLFGVSYFVYDLTKDSMTQEFNRNISREVGKQLDTLSKHIIGLENELKKFDSNSSKQSKVEDALVNLLETINSKLQKINNSNLKRILTSFKGDLSGFSLIQEELKGIHYQDKFLTLNNKVMDIDTATQKLYVSIENERERHQLELRSIQDRYETFLLFATFILTILVALFGYFGFTNLEKMVQRGIDEQAGEKLNKLTTKIKEAEETSKKLEEIEKKREILEEKIEKLQSNDMDIVKKLESNDTNINENIIKGIEGNYNFTEEDEKIINKIIEEETLQEKKYNLLGKYFLSEKDEIKATFYFEKVEEITMDKFSFYFTVITFSLALDNYSFFETYANKVITEKNDKNISTMLFSLSFLKNFPSGNYKKNIHSFIDSLDDKTLNKYSEKFQNLFSTSKQTKK